MSAIVSSSKVVQVCNISLTCQKEQLKGLFSIFGKIDELQLYPDRSVHGVNERCTPLPCSDTIMSTINGKVGYVKFDRIDGVHAALNMTNVILIDKPLIVSQVFENRIPDETDAMIYCAPLMTNTSLITGGPTWPSTVINRDRKSVV